MPGQVVVASKSPLGCQAIDNRPRPPSPLHPAAAAAAPAPSTYGSLVFCSISCLARLEADCQTEAGSEKER